MQRQKLIKIIILTKLTILIYFITKLLFFESDELQVISAEVTVQRFSRYGFIFPSSFNRSCTSEFLGLPSTLVKYCSSGTGAPVDPSSACGRFTCRNLLGDYDPGLHDLAANFTARNVTWTPVSTQSIVNETSDCAEFRRRRGFINAVSHLSDVTIG